MDNERPGITSQRIKFLARSINVESYMNFSKPSKALADALDPLFDALKDLAPLKSNDEAKQIWLIVPRGDISEFGDFEEWREEGETYEDFVEEWESYYPDDPAWIELAVAESDQYKFRAVSVDGKAVVSADMKEGYRDEKYWKDDLVIELCGILTKTVQDSMKLLKAGIYNETVSRDLPFRYRTGVVKRSDFNEAYPKSRENIFEGLDKETYEKFQKYIKEEDKTTLPENRIERFTGNDFLKACALGYMACGYDGTDLPLVDQYMMHADGRDEGLTGRGHGLHEGPGIDLDSPEAWNEWYYDRDRCGGHPWEVCRGGNSTHVDLYVMNPQDHYDFLLHLGKITQEEYDNRPTGYYFTVAGKAWTRSVEAVKFFVALKDAGLPVVLSDAKAILARFEATDYIGIVPEGSPTRYCEELFPESYGTILDFIHITKEELDTLGDKVEWIPEPHAALITGGANDTDKGE